MRVDNPVMCEIKQKRYTRKQHYISSNCAPLAELLGVAWGGRQQLRLQELMTPCST